MINFVSPYPAQRRNRALTITLWIVFAATVLFGIFNINLSEWRSAISIFSASAACLISVYLNTKKRPLAATILLCASVLITITYSILDGDGVFDPGIMGYPLFILLGTMLLNKRSTHWLFLAAVLSLALVTWSQANGITRPTIRINDISPAIPIVLFLAIASLIVWVIQDRQEHDLEQILKLNTELQLELAERKHAEEQILRLNEELENRVRERTAQLEQANKELESFSYSVSHDLRAPLRAITNFSRILKDDLSCGMDPAALSFLVKIIDAGNQMNLLIDELLDFSRLNRKELVKQDVLPGEIIGKVIQSIAPETANRQIEWILPELPATHADPILFEQVFANLIGNAVKYTGKREQARIEVGSYPKTAKPSTSSATMELGLTCAMPINYSACSNDCIARMNLKVPASAWQL